MRVESLEVVRVEEDARPQFRTREAPQLGGADARTAIDVSIESLEDLGLIKPPAGAKGLRREQRKVRAFNALKPGCFALLRGKHRRFFVCLAVGRLDEGTSPCAAEGGLLKRRIETEKVEIGERGAHHDVTAKRVRGFCALFRFVRARGRQRSERALVFGGGFEANRLFPFAASQRGAKEGFASIRCAPSRSTHNAGQK